jgi:hypothetical protein
MKLIEIYTELLTEGEESIDIKKALEKGYYTVTTKDPITGKEISTVHNLPKYLEDITVLERILKRFRPLKHSDKEDLKEKADDVIKKVNAAIKSIREFDALISLYKK